MEPEDESVEKEKEQADLVRPENKDVFTIPTPNASSTNSTNGSEDSVVPTSLHESAKLKFIQAEMPLLERPTLTFTGFEGLFANCCSPPDVQIAAGPSHVVQMVNLDGAIYSKQGTLLRSFSLSSFFFPPHPLVAKEPEPEPVLSDPRIIYDASSERWFSSIMFADRPYVTVAVSASNDPTGTWNLYSFEFGRSAMNDCADFAMISTSSDKFLISANVFSSGCVAPYVGGQYYIVSKDHLINRRPSPAFQTIPPDPTLYTLQPAKLYGSTSNLYVVTTDDGTADSLGGQGVVRLMTFTGQVTRVELEDTYISIDSTNTPPDAEQPCTATERGELPCVPSGRPPTDGARVLDAFWVGNILWFALNDRCVPAGDTQSRSCIRLVELDTTSNRLLQDFDIGSTGSYLAYPAISPPAPGTGNLVLVYGRSSDSIFPSLEISGQIGEAVAPESIETPILLRGGTALNTWVDERGGLRWGDYFGASQDPSDPSVVWVSGEYQNAMTDGWSTFIGRVVVPPRQ
jgi:hypothetical protein